MIELQKLIDDVREQAAAGYAALTCKQYSLVSANLYGLKSFDRIMKILEEAERKIRNNA